MPEQQRASPAVEKRVSIAMRVRASCRRRVRVIVLLIIITIILSAFLLLFQYRPPSAQGFPSWSLLHHETAVSSTLRQNEQIAGPQPLPCARLDGSDDIVFVIKTGATEALEKLPVHFNTTLGSYILVHQPHFRTESSVTAAQGTFCPTQA